jgi:hypothetical protein
MGLTAHVMQRSAYSLDRAPARAAPKLHLGPKAWMARVMCVLSRVCTAAEGLMHRTARRADRAAAAAVDAGWAAEPVHVCLLRSLPGLKLTHVRARSRNARPAIELEGTLVAPLAVLERPLEGKPKALYRNLRGHALVSSHLAALAPGVCPVASFSLSPPASAWRRRGPRKRAV